MNQLSTNYENIKYSITMKDIITKINESSTDFTNKTTTQGVFKEKVKYSLSDWNKWKKEIKEDVFFGNYETEPDLELIYIPDHENKTLKHIATYNKKTNILFCDDIKLFGHEI